MAVRSRHPIIAPPTAPVRESTRHLLLRGYAILLLFTALATTAVFNLIGIWGLAALVGVTTLLSIGLWIGIRPAFQWRRLPWFAVAFIAWAIVSLLWSQWPGATLTTGAALVATTVQGAFLAAVLTWREIIRAIASALKWILGLSLLFELWVAVVVQRPVLPNFLLWDGDYVIELAWSRGNLFDLDGRIQGIVGNAHLMAIAALLGLIVFGIRIASKAPRRGWLIAWSVLAALLLWRSGSATVYLALLAVIVVLGTVLLMRTTTRPGQRTKYYVLYAIVGVVGAASAWFLRGPVLEAFGKSGDLTGRQGIWDAVLERAVERPVLGWGFSSPWVPWDEHFDGWIIVNDLTVFHAHNMWLDVFMQLGAIGVVLLALAYLAFIWRSWFFAIDRPRWDLVADRPYQAVSLLPTLVATVLLVQGLAESRPLMEWGWLFLVMLATKIKQAPIVGLGPGERSLAMELGDRVPDEAARRS